jgi:hypothetical protein
MAVQLRDVDGDLLDRIIELADLPWSYRAFEDAFVRNGWHHVGDDGATVIGWLDAWPIGEDGRGSGGHWLELGEYPGCGDDPEAVCAHPECRTDCSIVLPFAYFTEGETPEGWNGDAGLDDYDAAYDRMAALLRARLGEPEPPGPGAHVPEFASRALVWPRGESRVVLLDGDDAFSYGSCRRAGIEVRPGTSDR